MFATRTFGAVMLLLFLGSADAQQYWSQFTNSPSGTTRHDDFSFVDATNGWCTKGSRIYKTTDGGNTWVQKIAKTGTHFRSIAFVSETRGWAGNLGAGSYDSSVTDTNVLYETFDGGETWSPVPALNQTSMKGFCALYALDSMHLYGGGRVRGPAHFCKTENGGTNWMVVDLMAQGVMNGIMDVYFRDPNNGFVVGMDTNTFGSNCGLPYHGRIARTTDGGQTWTPVLTTELACCYFWKMSWPSTNVGYASLQQNASTYPNVIFYKTIDGGNTWVSNGIPVAQFGISSFFVQGIGFVNEAEGWIGGSANSSPNNFIHTVDGGHTWTTMGYNNSLSINRIRFLSPLLGVAAGQKMHVYRAPLAITAHPRSTTLNAGTNLNLSIAAVGSTTLNYQWKKNGSILPGETNAMLLLTNVTRVNDGSYSVTVTNSGGSAVSSNAMVRVLTPEQMQVPQILTNGTIRLLFGDADGAPLSIGHLTNFTVSASSNLVEWLELTNPFVLTNGLLRLDDLSVSNVPRRFYRVIER